MDTETHRQVGDPMRLISDHRTFGYAPAGSPQPMNDRIEVIAHGSPNPAGANRIYSIGLQGAGGPPLVLLRFQEGDPELGINGITVESLLAVCADRLRSFQAGKFSDRDNAIALTEIENALMRLQRRQKIRQAAGVLGLQQALPVVTTAAAVSAPAGTGAVYARDQVQPCSELRPG